MKSKISGYSLVELILVLLILIILSAGIFVYIGFFRSIKLDSAATKIAADLKYAQSLAMSTTQWYGVSFNVSPDNTYSVYTTNGTTDTVVEDPAHFGSNLAVNTASDFDSSISSVSIGGGNKVEFSPLGQPYTDRYGLPLLTEGIITLTAGSNSKTIRITPNTGRISVQ